MVKNNFVVIFMPKQCRAPKKKKKKTSVGLKFHIHHAERSYLWAGEPIVFGHKAELIKNNRDRL